MEQVLKVANSFPIWIIAALVIGIVIFQAVVFIRLASKTAPSVGLTTLEVRSVVRTGAISSLGPSFAIIIVAISLITFLGNPVTLMRIGIVGSAPIETVGASLGAQAAGSELGSSTFTEQAFTTAVWVMCLGGMGWLLVTALFTKSLGKFQEKISRKNSNVRLLSIVSTAAMIGAFGYFGAGQMIRGINETVVFIAAFLVMPVIIWASNKFKMNWLREWSLGLVIVVGLSIGLLLT
ncbi:DUF5058 family protein [Sporosarcina psychrophila]|uniref:Flagellar biogenesis protein FliO n=1 Tax=Sporosarcina psychrophila TaxID=1476 RepID=A0ABV2K8S2_SPOPS|nr:DUF5058 family protein [Sporosarcina psychrophila]AMQ04678.1 translation elongation factor EF-1alpha [Sporosarcina psychrophila]